MSSTNTATQASSLSRPDSLNPYLINRNFSTAKFFLLLMWKSASPSISSVASHSTKKPQRISLRLPSFLISDLRKPETCNLDEILDLFLR